MNHLRHFKTFILPVFLFGSFSGVLTGALITLYRFCASRVIGLSGTVYDWLRAYPVRAVVAVAVLAVAAFFYSRIYRRWPNLKGGGIPASIAALRGMQPVRWACDIIGVFLLSLSTFFIGVPLGNEGPSVQMGTAVGDGCVRRMPKRFRAWSRYAMTAGASAGFTAATGAPISGIMFALEDAHQRISPMIILTSFFAVICSHITASVLAPLVGMETGLFSVPLLPELSVAQFWIPLVVGLVLGMFAVLFLRYYTVLHHLMNRTMKRIPSYFRILAVLLLTLLCGLLREEFISTGHHLIAHLFEGKTAVTVLLLTLVVRATLTLLANTAGLSGGLFLPIMALGASISALLANGLTALLPDGGQYYALILTLGIAACIGGMMKTPITAVAFAVEALGCHGNILPVIIASVVAFAVTEVFRVESINENVVENRMHALRGDAQARVVETDVTVSAGAFVVGKQVRDIFWPNNLFVFSVKHTDDRDATIAEADAKAIRAGDVLHIRYSTYDDAKTIEELRALVGDDFA